MRDSPPPTLYEWAGGAAALERLTAVFYERVLADPLVRPLFEQMSPEHPQHVAIWLGEIFGGPHTYSEHLGGHAHMISKHLNKHLSEPERARWALLIAQAADEAGLPSDPEFRSAFVAYSEWGTRMSVLFSQPGVTPPGQEPMPYWGWGERPPYQPPTE